MPVNWRAWSAADDAAVRKGYAAGAPAGRIAAELRRTPNAVKLRACRLGIVHRARRPWTAADDATLRAGYAAGLPAGRIARRVDRSALAVRTRAGLLGAVHATRWTAAEDDAIRQGRAAGRTDRAVGRAIGRSRDAVTHRAGALGLAGPRQAKRAAHPEPASGRAWTAAEDDAVRAGRAAGRTARDVRPGALTVSFRTCGRERPTCARFRPSAGPPCTPGRFAERAGRGAIRPEFRDTRA